MVISTNDCDKGNQGETKHARENFDCNIEIEKKILRELLFGTEAE
jgi:hypothetical protein